MINPYKNIIKTKSFEEAFSKDMLNVISKSYYPVRPDEALNFQHLQNIAEFLDKAPIPKELKEKYKPNEIGSVLYDNFKLGEISFSEYLSELNASLND